MSRIEPIQLIENPLSEEATSLLASAASDIHPKRHSGPISFPLINTNEEQVSFNGKKMGLGRLPHSQSESHHLLLRQNASSPGLSPLSSYVTTTNIPSSTITTVVPPSLARDHLHGGATKRLVNKRESNQISGGGSLPTDPLLTSVNSPIAHAKTLQTRLEDDGYCSSFTSKNSEGVSIHPQKTNQNVITSPLDISDPSSLYNTDDPEEEERETWSQGLDFLLSIIGFAVDLANVWRFPYYCYKNGGGAFLIPYFLMLALSAIPVFYMELLLGQSIRQGPISVWKICPLFKGIGYCAVTVSYFVSFYYNTIMGWSLHYTVNSFSSPLPWTTCNNSWNTPECFIPPDKTPSYFNTTTNETIKMFERPANATSPASEYFRNSVLEMENHSIDNLGSPKLDLLVCLAVIYSLLYVILFKGIRSTGKVVWITATMPYVILFILLCRGLMLEGASDGIYYYLVPNMTKLKEVGVWSDAAKQIFFSSGAGFGVHLTYASYNPFHNNCFRDCVVTSIVNAFTSIFSGFVIFTFLGSMAHRQDRPIQDVVNVGPGLVFEVYPEAVGTLPGANFWSVLFFLMLIMLGIDSAMGGLECVITGITDEFKTWFRRRKYSRELFMFVCVFISFLISIINITRGGVYTFTFFDTYAAGSSLLFAVFFEVLVVSWVYDAEAMLGSAPGIYWRICWKFISPLLILTIIILDLSTSTPLVHDGYEYPQWAQIFGYIFTFFPIMFVPLIGLIEFCKAPSSTCKGKLSYAITPINEHSQIKDKKYVKRFKLSHWLYLR